MPPPLLLIRKARASDLDTVLDLIEAAGLDAPGSNDRAASPALFDQMLRCGGSVLLAERAGVPAGTLTWFVLPLLAHSGRPAALIEDVAVAPAWQGSGVGRALVQAAMQRARAAGCYKLALSSNARRAGAHAFYERLGFARHGVSFSVELDELAVAA